MHTQSINVVVYIILDYLVPRAAAGFCRHCRSHAANTRSHQLSLTCTSDNKGSRVPFPSIAWVLFSSPIEPVVQSHYDAIPTGVIFPPQIATASWLIPQS